MNIPIWTGTSTFAVGQTPFGFYDNDVDFKNDADKVANTKLLSELSALNEELNVPTPKEFGIDKKDFMNKLEIMAEQAVASGSPGNNPRVPSNMEIIDIYKLLWQ